MSDYYHPTPEELRHAIEGTPLKDQKCRRLFKNRCGNLTTCEDRGEKACPTCQARKDAREV